MAPGGSGNPNPPDKPGLTHKKYTSKADLLTAVQDIHEHEGFEAVLVVKNYKDDD